MTPEIDNLLSVLHMSEEEQLKFLDGLWEKREIPEECMFKPNMASKLVMTPHNRRVLADLAFRKRNEAVKRYGIEGKTPWNLATALIWGHCTGTEMKYSFDEFWLNIAQPIHLIIAAEIAKRLAGSK